MILSNQQVSAMSRAIYEIMGLFFANNSCMMSPKKVLKFQMAKGGGVLPQPPTFFCRKKLTACDSEAGRYIIVGLFT